MLCIQEELGQMGITDQNDLPYQINHQQHPQQKQQYANHHYEEEDPRQVQRDLSDSSSAENTACRKGWPPNGFGQGMKPAIGWMDGLFGCMRPVLSLIGKGTVIDVKKPGDEWEIPFEDISDLEFLGSGAQGAVYSGKLRTDIVAVKKVRDVRETDIKNLRKLDHENIIKFVGVCTQAPVFCIIMEFCPYGTLQQILKEEQNIPPETIVSWSKQIAFGMQYLHSHKIIHRDLKSPKWVAPFN